MKFSVLLEALQNPKIYPEKPESVEMIQTHVSAIFLAGEHVYKIKKPVDFGFLDFTTLEKRKYFCEEEVRLNRRLSPEVYLGVVAIRQHETHVALGEGPGEIVEYAVLMKKLPQECMMDRRLSAGKVTPERLQEIAGKVAQFHDRAASNAEISSFGQVEVIRTNMEENFSQTEKYVDVSLSQKEFQEIRDQTRLFLKAQLSLFAKRIADARIRDCHGDLHLQHICLTDEILIFDCIEFNQRFRYGDVAADIAFLLMDLDFHGYAQLSADLAAGYLAISKDWPLYLLLNFYKAYRAYVRGKVISFRLDDPAISDPEKTAALEESRRYFQLASLYAQRMNRPRLLVTCGLMGTGKSTIARALTDALNWTWLCSDQVRKELARIPAQERRYEPFEQGIYAPDFSEKTYQALFAQARAFLQRGSSVVLDASFKKERDRAAARALAGELNADFLLIECTCAEETIRERLEHRVAKRKEPSDGRWEIFQEQKEDFEKIEGMDPGLFLSLDTRFPLASCLQTILYRLLKREAPALVPESKRSKE
jgi:uncharacterized protein